MSASNEISHAARAAYRIGFGASTNVAVLAFVLALAIVGGLMLHAIISKPTIIYTLDAKKCREYSELLVTCPK